MNLRLRKFRGDRERRKSGRKKELVVSGDVTKCMKKEHAESIVLKDDEQVFRIELATYM